MNDKPLIFISYSHDDKEWLDRLKKHLGVLYYNGFCDIFSDRDLLGGQDFEIKIYEAINQCYIAILLISPSFLSSDFINKKEIPRLLYRFENHEIHIYPLLVRPCAFKYADWLSKLLIRPDNAVALSSNMAEISNKSQ